MKPKDWDSWHDAPPPFNPDAIPNHDQLMGEVRSAVFAGEPYESREARAEAFDKAYKRIRPKYKSYRELEEK